MGLISWFTNMFVAPAPNEYPPVIDPVPVFLFKETTTEYVSRAMQIKILCEAESARIQEQKVTLRNLADQIEHMGAGRAVEDEYNRRRADCLRLKANLLCPRFFWSAKRLEIEYILRQKEAQFMLEKGKLLFGICENESRRMVCTYEGKFFLLISSKNGLTCTHNITQMTDEELQACL